MIKVEYLVFVDSNNVKCKNINSFEHLLQSDPDLEIENDTIIYKKNFKANYNIQTGQIGDTEKVYFHLKFHITKPNDIDKLTLLLKSVKSIFTIITKTPQTLYDGISQHYAEKAYPIIYDIENLMRKLITKFMLINVGADWISEKVPDDVKNSVNQENKDITYLHNVDFIQLKNFIFSEKYTVNRDKLITTLKTSSNLSELNLEELKKMIPISNWDRYFSNEIHISQEKLSNQWSELYDLRCKVAHNKVFTKIEFNKVEELVNNLKPTLEKAIDKLDSIDISKEDRENLEEQIVGNFSQEHGKFIEYWRVLENLIFKTVESKVRNEKAELISQVRTFSKDVKLLYELKLLDNNIFETIQRLKFIRNRVVHYDESIESVVLEFGTIQLLELINKLENLL